MLSRRWWTCLLRPPSAPLSFCTFSSPSSVSEHSCTARCSSTCRATGEFQSTGVTLHKRGDKMVLLCGDEAPPPDLQRELCSGAQECGRKPWSEDLLTDDLKKKERR